MLKSYSHDNLRKGRYVKATKRPFFPRLAAGARLSVRRASAGSGPKPTTWSLTATSPQDKHNDQDYAARVLQAKSRHCDRSDDP